MRKVTHECELKCASDSYELLTVNSYHIMKGKQKWVMGSALGATSGSVNPVPYMRSGDSWLQEVKSCKTSFKPNSSQSELFQSGHWLRPDLAYSLGTWK